MVWMDDGRESKGTEGSQGRFPLDEMQDVNCEYCHLIFS